MRCRSPSTGLRSLFRELNSSDWRSKSDARASRSARTSLRVREAARLKRGVQKVSADGDRIQRRDASVHPLLQRSRIHRRSRPRGVVRRLQGSRQDVSGSIETGNSKELFRLLASGFWLLLLANGERVTAYLLYNGSAS